MSMLKINQAILVEGKYDKIKLPLLSTESSSLQKDSRFLKIKKSVP